MPVTSLECHLGWRAESQPVVPRAVPGCSLSSTFCHIQGIG